MTQVSAKTVIVLELDLTQRSFNMLINLSNNKIWPASKFSQTKMFILDNIVSSHDSFWRTIIWR